MSLKPDSLNNEIFCFVVNEFETNCYIYKDPNSDSAMIIDPGGETLQIVEFVKKNNFNIEKICITHGHYDHINGLEEMLNFFKVPVYIFEEEIDIIIDDTANLSIFLNKQMNIKYDRIEWVKLKDNDTVSCGTQQFYVMHTPGHTKGSMCLYLKDNYLFTGDTLFCGSVGRTDFPTGDMDLLDMSLKKIFSLPEDTIFFPGHQSSCVLKKEKLHNPFVKLVV